MEECTPVKQQAGSIYGIYMVYIWYMVYISYYDSKMNKKYKISIQRSALKSYITNIVKLYLYDSDPFDNIQFNFTGFPSFMTNKNNLQQNPNIMPTLQNTTSILIESIQEEPLEESLLR